MSDNLTKKQRQHCMSQIKSGNTKPEITIRKLIWKKGYRYRIGHGLRGKPDMVFPSYGIAVFIDGCFWHGCHRHYKMPASNVNYWKQKISGNKRRDKKIERHLKKAGWKVIRIWEHDVKKNPEKIVDRIISNFIQRKSP